MSIMLKILSGAHLGADIELADGEYRIGSDPSCDIVLTDAALAPVHAVVTLAGGAVTIAPSDGVVLVNGQPVTGAVAVPALTVVTVGGTHFAPGPAGEAWPAVPLPELFNIQQVVAAPEAPLADASAEGNAALAPEAAPLSEAAATPPLMPEQKRSTTKQRAEEAIKKLEGYDRVSSWIWMLQGIAGAGVLAWVLLYIMGYMVVSDTQLDEMVLLMRGQNIAMEIARDDGTPSPDGVLTVRHEGSAVVIEGVVRSKQNAYVLRNLTSDLGYPVVIRVRVLDDAVRIVTMEVKRRGLALSVKPDTLNRIFVQGYVQEKQKLQDLRDWLKETLQGSFRYRTHLVTWSMVEPVLLEEAKRISLHDVAFLPAPTEVVAVGKKRALASGEWLNVALAAQKRLQVSLAFRPYESDINPIKLNEALSGWFRRQQAAEPGATVTPDTDIPETEDASAGPTQAATVRPGTLLVVRPAIIPLRLDGTTGITGHFADGTVGGTFVVSLPAGTPGSTGTSADTVATVTLRTPDSAGGSLGATKVASAPGSVAGTSGVAEPKTGVTASVESPVGKTGAHAEMHTAMTPLSTGAMSPSNVAKRTNTSDVRPPEGVVDDLRGMMADLRESIPAANDGTVPVAHGDTASTARTVTLSDLLGAGTDMHVSTDVDLSSGPKVEVVQPPAGTTAGTIPAPATPYRDFFAGWGAKLGDLGKTGKPASQASQTLVDVPQELLAGGTQVTAVELAPQKRFRDQRGEWHLQGQILSCGYWVKDVFENGAVLANNEQLVILQMQ